jgi:hypothetical protein
MLLAAIDNRPADSVIRLVAIAEEGRSRRRAWEFWDGVNDPSACEQPTELGEILRRREILLIVRLRHR